MLLHLNYPLFQNKSVGKWLQVTILLQIWLSYYNVTIEGTVDLLLQHTKSHYKMHYFYTDFYIILRQLCGVSIRIFPEQCRPVLFVRLQQRQLPPPWFNERVATAASSEHAAFSPESARVSDNMCRCMGTRQSFLHDKHSPFTCNHQHQ